MKPEIRSIDSPDVDDIENPYFEGPEDEHLLLQLHIGPKAEEWDEMFSVVACTPAGLESRHKGKTPRLLRHHLLVETYDYEGVVGLIEKTCDRIREETWTEVAEKLSRYFTWEFEDYKPCTFAIFVSLVLSVTGCAGIKSSIKPKNDPSGHLSGDIPSREHFENLALETGKSYAELISEPIDNPAYTLVALQPFERKPHEYRAHYVLLWSGHYRAHGCPKRESKADCHKFGSPPRIFVASIVSAPREPGPYVEPRWSSPNVDFPKLTPTVSIQNDGAYGDLLDAEYRNETLRVRVKHSIIENADTTTTKVIRYHLKFNETNRNWRISRKETLDQRTHTIGGHHHYSD